MIKKNISFIISILILIGLNAGCGKKGQPFALVDRIIASPTSLDYKLENDILTIKWSYLIPINNPKNLLKCKQFQVFQAKKNILKNKCKICPIKFKPIGSVPGRIFEYSFKIKKGFKYYYKIMALSDDNIKSEFSNILEFEYKK
ncbi:MAG: hypothetical protein B6I26_00805 [Desulfobacteraceae bacterium 4572_130]|nr:MAG: hypothetical protein B6I26_00805 [Desulfobacteraceae bacterium 4572_130]